MYTTDSPYSTDEQGGSDDRNLASASSTPSASFTQQQQQHQSQQQGGSTQSQDFGQVQSIAAREHLDGDVSSDESGSSVVGELSEYSNDGVFQSQSKLAPRRMNSNRIVTTEETVCSSQSSNSPQRNLPMSSIGPPPTLMSSSLGSGHESEDNETMIDSNNRQINTRDVALVRPYDDSNESSDPMMAITREESIKNERESETEDEKENRWTARETHLLDPKYSDGEVRNDYDNKIENEMEDKIENSSSYRNGSYNTSLSFDIATFPTSELLEMLTALLDKIVKSNDRLSCASEDFNPDQENISLNQTNRDHLKSVLSFRGKHIPQISLEHYFQRIQKYCPTTNDVFLSLLVYFDRISKKCNSNYSSSDDKQISNGEHQHQAFVMDSHNIHRLLIAGVTVSTKFFSDFFYSNSRYARVGGISLQELNHLELQFLVLSDFELLISTNELQRYADLLYKFWSSSSEVDAENNPTVSVKT